MLVSYNWLKDFLNMEGVDPYALAEKLTRSGVEIASTVHPQAGLSKLVVGHVLTCELMEGTHLHKTTVDVGEEEPKQIICGAPNVAAGQDVIVALPGAHIAGGHKIKKGKLRGEVSDGMICGLQEIGFADALVPPKYADGIFVFHEEGLKPGEEVFKALGMDDYILDFDITPNRADTSSMEGAAYEVGALIDQKPKIEDVVLKEDGPDWTAGFTATADIKVAPKYYLRKVTGVKIGESPLWMQTRLWNAGIRPINNVVDATNYVMLLTGQPMHAYDAAMFKNGRIDVRLAKEGEKLQLLNEKELDLDPEDVVITDGEKAVGLAGVMGGYNSEVTESTTDVILEAAVFDPALIRKAALRHDNRTYASALFEKGINWDNTQKALDACALILRNDANGTVCAGEVKATDEKRDPVVITTTASRTNKLLGTNLSMDEIVKIFHKLNFAITTDGDSYTVTVPNRRWDIFIDADLFEEVGRIYGYDNIKSTHPETGEISGGYTEEETKIRHLRNLAEGQGLTETINYSLTSDEMATTFVKQPLPAVKVNWPLNSSRTTMRQNLICGLLDTIAYNFARKQTELQLFENARVYDKADGEYNEHEHLAAAYVGNAGQSNWQHQDEKIDFYYVKGQLEDLLEMVGISKGIEYRPEVINGMHPTRTAGIYINDEYVGLIGQIAPVLTVSDKNFAGKEIYVYELNLEKILPLMTKGVKSVPAPKYPAVERDLSILVDKDVTNAAVVSAIEDNAGKYLVKVDVIDVYAGAHLPNGKKSLAYRLTFLNEKDTLTDEVVSKAMTEVQNALEEKVDATIR